MRIAQVCHRYYPNRGGVESHVKEISERLAARHHDVEVICADGDGWKGAEVEAETEVGGVRVRRFKSVAPNDAYFFAPQIFSYLKRSDFDIIHAHNYHAFPALFASLAKEDRKFVFTPHYHGTGSTALRDFLSRPYKLIGSGIFRRADRIICVSNYEKELVKEDFGVEDADVVVIPNGIDLYEIRRARPFEFDGTLILYVGRLERYKNIHLVIEAMKHLPEDFYFYVGGKGSYERRLRDLVRRLDLRGRVRFLGPISDEEKYRWMKTCSLFVNLSSVEAFGVAALEALAAGKPVIVNDRGGLREIAEKFHDAVTSIHAENISEERLASLIEKAMGKVAKIDVSEYDWNCVVDKIEDVYEKVGV